MEEGGADPGVTSRTRPEEAHGFTRYSSSSAKYGLRYTKEMNIIWKNMQEMGPSELNRLSNGACFPTQNRVTVGFTRRMVNDKRSNDLHRVFTFSIPVRILGFSSRPP